MWQEWRLYLIAAGAALGWLGIAFVVALARFLYVRQIFLRV